MWCSDMQLCTRKVSVTLEPGQLCVIWYMLIYEAPHFRTKYSNLDRMRLETLLDCQVGRWRALATRSSLMVRGWTAKNKRHWMMQTNQLQRSNSRTNFSFGGTQKLPLPYTSLSTRVILFLFISGNSMRCWSLKQTATEPSREIQGLQFNPAPMSKA